MQAACWLQQQQQVLALVGRRPQCQPATLQGAEAAPHRLIHNLEPEGCCCMLQAAGVPIMGDARQRRAPLC